MCKIMRINIYLEDLKDEVIERIRERLKHELVDEITEAAMSARIDRQEAEMEIISDYLNTHNFSQTIEL
jgi:hypothetical protein